MVVIPLFLLILITLVSCLPAAATVPTISGTAQSVGMITPSATLQPVVMITPRATVCPVETSEIFMVAPVTSPTDQLSQTVHVWIGNGESVTVITESGTFTSTEDPKSVEVSLLPDTVHHLEVIAKVRTIVHSDGCTYGGYTQRTTRDSFGAPLTIVQGNPIPKTASETITPENASRLEELTSFAPNVRYVTDFVFTNQHDLISVGFESNISFWNPETGQEIRQLGDAQAGGVAVTTSSDSSLIATGGTAHGLRLWNAQTGEMTVLGTPEVWTLWRSLAFDLQGTRLVSGDDHDTVMVWNVNDGRALLTLKGDVPNRLQSFSRLYWVNNDTLAAAGSTAIYWWDANTGALLKRIAKPAEPAFLVDADFTQSGDRIAAAAQDAYVYFWDQKVNQWSRWPAPVDATITRVRFSPDGQLLLSGTYKGGLLIWDVQSGQLLSSYATTSSSLATIQFSPDGRYIAAGGGDGPIRLWGIP
jgi:WD40 repeat protein